MDDTTHTLITDLITREGDYSDHPADKGGPTRYGITQAALSDYLGRKANVQEIKSLSLELAKEIYYTRYYLLPRIDALPCEIQSFMLDMCVNHGPKPAIRLLQHVINESEIAMLAEDGICGPATQAAAKDAQKRMGMYLTNALVEERLTFFRRIVSRDPSQFVFLKGWESRAESFRL